MERALINNMVNGVGTGFEKILEFIGVGYRAEMKGKDFVFSLGYSHNIDFKLPVGVTGSLLKEGRDVAIKIEGPDKQLLGQVAAQIRSLRPPEPYKGKGVRYRGEEVKRKAGKAGKK
jgi:large subunit ribosomal protein L6